MSLKPCLICGAITPSSRCPTHTIKRTRGRAGQAIRRHILQRDDYRCHLCGKGGADVVDHVIPLARGGQDTDANRKAAHAYCNSRKGAKLYG